MADSYTQGKVKVETPPSNGFAAQRGKSMRIQVIIGIDYRRKLDYARVADSTLEPYKINTYPKEGEGWVFWDFGKGEPDWGWGDYTFTIGTVEAGRHEITGRILATEDVEGYLINAYERFSELTDTGAEGL